MLAAMAQAPTDDKTVANSRVPRLALSFLRGGSLFSIKLSYLPNFSDPVAALFAVQSALLGILLSISTSLEGETSTTLQKNPKLAFLEAALRLMRDSILYSVLEGELGSEEIVERLTELCLPKERAEIVHHFQ